MVPVEPPGQQDARPRGNTLNRPPGMASAMARVSATGNVRSSSPATTRTGFRMAPKRARCSTRRGTTLSIAQQTESVRAAATVELMYSTTSGFVRSVVSLAKALTARSTTGFGTVRRRRSIEVISRNSLFWRQPATEAVQFINTAARVGADTRQRIRRPSSAPGVAEQDAVLDLQLIQDLA